MAQHSFMSNYCIQTPVPAPAQVQVDPCCTNARSDIYEARSTKQDTCKMHRSLVLYTLATHLVAVINSYAEGSHQLQARSPPHSSPRASWPWPASASNDAGEAWFGIHVQSFAVLHCFIHWSC